jgi:hydrogenase maturation protease
MAETLIIGLGNPLVSDDSVGLRVAAELRNGIGRPRGCRRGRGLLGWAASDGADDRLPAGDRHRCDLHRPGARDLHRLTPDAIATQKSASAHDVSLPTALAFGRQAGAELPDDKDVTLLGIEALDLVNFSEQCTPAVTAAIPRAVREVLQILESMQGEPVS